MAGLALAWHSLEQGAMPTLFDPCGVGQKASGAAAGLLHPYGGAGAKKSKFCDEAIRDALELAEVAKMALGEPVIQKTGLLRLAVLDAQKKDFQKVVDGKEVFWQDAQTCQNMAPAITPHSGIWIPGAWQIDTPKYLKGLWEACRMRGATLVERRIKASSELEGFDRVIFATGAQTREIAELENLSIGRLKGQILEFSGDLPLSFPVNSRAYLLPGKTFILGATFEREFTCETPLVDQARKLLLPKGREILPNLEDYQIVGCRAGIRATTPDKMPLAKQVGEKSWILTGLGSKGLLYHALFAKNLTKTSRAIYHLSS